MRRIPRDVPTEIDHIADTANGFDAVRAEAGPTHLDTLKWIDRRCVAAGMHPLDDWWLATFAEFYATGKLILAGRVGLRGGKSDSVVRALVNDVLFAQRTLDPGVVGVAPILSTDRTEASGRLYAVKRILLACGIAATREDGVEPLAGGLGGEFTSTVTPAGGGVVRTLDSQGHVVEWRIYPATRNSAIGFTAVGGFCDEIDLWRDRQTSASPASEVLDLLGQRFTTTIATSRLYLFSASYGGESAHTRILDKGDHPLQHVARLGPLGAARDTAARLELAALAVLPDPRLTAPADPKSPNVPSWVTNPAAPIMVCRNLSSDLGAMFTRYGGQPQGGAGAAIDYWSEQTGPTPLGSVVVGPAPGEDDRGEPRPLVSAPFAASPPRRW